MRRRIRIKRNKRGFLGVTVLVMVICGVFYYGTLRLDAQINDLSEQQASYEKTKAELLKEQDKLKSKTEVTLEDVEKEARDKLGMVYPDEILLTPEDSDQ